MMKLRKLLLKDINGAASAAKLDALAVGVVIQVDHVAPHAGIFSGSHTVNDAVVGDDIHFGAQGNDISINSRHADLNKRAGGGGVIRAAVAGGIGGGCHAFRLGELQGSAGGEDQHTAAVLCLFDLQQAGRWRPRRCRIR